MRLASLLMFAVVFTGCEINSNNTKIQYMPDMADAPTVKAQESYIDPPEHSVPINGVLYPETVEESEKVLKNPYPASEQIVADGKHLFETFCTVCHGSDGKGDNALGAAFPRPPDITIPQYRERADGFYFHRITFGSAIMPSYGHAISPNERWKIIHYLRTLQK
jgi:mono/diheme cytochrome c family protein